MSLQILKTVCNTCQHLMVSTHRALWWRTQRRGEIGVCSCVEGRMIDLGAQNEDTRSRKPLHCVLFTDWNYLLGPVPWSAVSDQNAIWIWKAKKITVPQYRGLSVPWWKDLCLSSNPTPLWMEKGWVIVQRDHEGGLWVFSIQGKCELLENRWQTVASSNSLWALGWLPWVLYHLEGEHGVQGQKQKNKKASLAKDNLGRVMKSTALEMWSVMVRTVVLPSEWGGEPIRKSTVMWDQRQLGKMLYQKVAL